MHFYIVNKVSPPTRDQLQSLLNLYIEILSTRDGFNAVVAAVRDGTLKKLLTDRNSHMIWVQVPNLKNGSETDLPII